MIFAIARKSLSSRKGSVLLTLLSLVVSIALLISVEHIRKEARDSFGRTVSGVDLIVGARTGQLNLLLYSVFRVGNATNNIKWENYQEIIADPKVKWAIPISLGDSHRGYRVMGTTEDYFTHFRFGKKQPLTFKNGEAFDAIFETVIGSEVANKLGYKVGDKFTISHGVGAVSFSNHDQANFVITGILNTTGTPVDQTVHVNLESLEAVHLNPKQLLEVVAAVEAGEPLPNLEAETITAFMLGLSSKFATFGVQRNINQYTGEPLLAILPGVALTELWEILGTVENLLRVIAFMILLSSLFGLATMLLASMRERHKEIAVLRAIGAGPLVIFVLIQAEALMIALLSLVISIGSVWLTLVLSGDWLSETYGLFIESNLMNMDTLIISGIVLAATFVVATIPAVGAYRRALHSGLSAG